MASRCGYTPQYEDLQALWTTYKNKNLVVLGVPTNNFRQEPGSNKEIKDFCETNFGITFPMTEKKLMLSVIMLTRFINGQEKIMESEQFQNGIFIK